MKVIIAVEYAVIVASNHRMSVYSPLSVLQMATLAPDSRPWGGTRARH